MTNSMRKMPLLGLVMGSLLLLGCGGGVSSLCDAICECEGCSDNDFDDCIDNGEDAARDAEREGCGEPADEYLACLNSEAECRDGDLDVDGCSFEAKNLNECLD